jgi:hypothetical protein
MLEITRTFALPELLISDGFDWGSRPGQELSTEIPGTGNRARRARRTEDQRDAKLALRPGKLRPVTGQ